NPEAGVVLAWTRVNNCLVFCHNAVPEFLAIARHLSQNNDFCSQSEEIFRKVFHANFSSHQATLFLTGSALQNTYFRSYWLFRNEPEWRWMELGLVDFEERPDEWVERRYFLSGNSVIKGERTDLDQLACFVPETAYVNLCAEKDAEKLAEKLERYLFPEEMGKEIKGKMVSLLAAGQPDSYGVVLEPFFEADFFLRWKRALLLHLTRPEKFNRAEFLKVTREIYGQSFFPGGSSPASFDWKKSALSGKEVYLLEPPLFPGSSLAMAAVGPVLFLANSGDFLQKMVNSSGQKWEIDPGSFHLIRADGQKLWNSYQKTISFLASSPDWSTQEAATFFQENIPSLAVWFEPVKGFFFEERVRENCLEQVVRYRLR
ncbi:MAG TPA: hypothetical protein PKX93_07875, partial [bacterium]|nr:hypothetical protein [bacterium]